MTRQPMPRTLARQALAEYLGTMLLVAVVVGSGIMASRLSPTDVGLQLFENSFATAGGLIALILAFGSISGAHFNPVVSLIDWRLGGLALHALGVYIAAQITGAISGSILANLMFDLSAVEWSTKARSGSGIWLAEGVATVGLVLVIFGSVRGGNGRATPFAVGAYIGSAYFFTSSTSFANPAVTIGRAFTDTFAGIEPADVAGFIAAQLVGAVIAYGFLRFLFPTFDGANTVVPHDAQVSP